MTPNAPAWVPKDAVGYGSRVCEAACKERRTVEREGYASGAIPVVNITGAVWVQLPSARNFDRGRIRG